MPKKHTFQVLFRRATQMRPKAAKISIQELILLIFLHSSETVIHNINPLTLVFKSGLIISVAIQYDN